MYDVDERDLVVKLEEFPQSSVGAPMPSVLADEQRVWLSYRIQEREFWAVPNLRPSLSEISKELLALVEFRGCLIHMLGWPNDEALAGHPLVRRGLRPYSVFRIDDSSWIRRLEKMNSIHPRHQPQRFWKKQHLLFTFHDSTFECVCDGFEVRQIRRSRAGGISDMIRLWEKDMSR